jgi:hypothetical protein
MRFDVLDPLLDQLLSLAMQPLGVLLLDARNPYDAARIRLAAQMAAERPQHPLDVDPVGLGAPPAGSPADSQGRRHDCAPHVLRAGGAARTRQPAS